MVEGDVRKVGERGQVTIPKWLREKEGLEGGDEVVVRDEDGAIIIEKKDSEEGLRERLKEGYKATAERDRRIAEEWRHVSHEANKHLPEE